MTEKGSNLLLSGFVLAALLGLLLLGRERMADIGDARAVRGWRPTACTIQESRFRPYDNTEASSFYPEPMYRAEVRYTYTVDGREYESDRVAPAYTGGGDAAEEHRRARSYSSGESVTCWVSPDDPRKAYLEQAAPWYLEPMRWTFVYLILYAAFILYLIWRRSGPLGQSMKAVEAAFAVSPLALIGLFMLALGWHFGWNNLIRPLSVVADMDDWRAADCELVVARTKWTFHAPDPDLPTVVGYDILYRYRDDAGRHFVSNQYDAFGGLAPDEPEEIPGSLLPCWHDPDQPARSVLRRGVSFNAFKAAAASVVAAVTGIVLLWLSYVWVAAARRETRPYGSYL